MTDKSTKIDDAKVIKDLKKLNRRELLEIMLAQGREIDRLNEKVAELEAELHSDTRVCAEEESAMPQQESATAKSEPAMPQPPAANTESAMPEKETVPVKAEPNHPESKPATEKAESCTAANRESASKPAPAASSESASKPALAASSASTPKPAPAACSAPKPNKASGSQTVPRKNAHGNRSGKHSAKRRGIFGTGIRLSIRRKTSEKHSEKR